jgi:hypothetical protein
MPAPTSCVWEAIGVGKISQKTLENLDERVREGVTNFFEMYPFIAGMHQPPVGEK